MFESAMQEADGDSSISAVLAEARELTRRGKYAAAEELLHGALACHDGNLQLTLELAETYTIQGYVNRAYSLVDCDKLPQDSVLGDVLRMLRCVLMPMVSGQFTESIKQADKINSKYNVIELSDAAFMPVATIKLFYYKVLALYSIHHYFEGTARMEASQQEVIVIIDILLNAGDMPNVFKFSNVLLDKSKKQERLERLIELEATPRLIRAKAQAELADILEGPGSRQLKDQLRELARPILKEEHCHAALDIDIGQAIEELQEFPERPARTEIDSLLLAYKALDYPNGLKMWLHRLLNIATKSNTLEILPGLEEELKALSIETGTSIFLLVLRVNNIARFHLHTGYDDLVKTTLLNAYYDLVSFEVPFTLGQVGFILTDHFVRLRDASQALVWANRCISHWKVCPPATQSMGSLQLLRAEILHFEKSNSVDYKAIQTLCEDFVATDLAAGMRQEATMKLGLMIGFLYLRKEIPLDQRFDHINEYLTRSESILNSITDSDIRSQKAALLQQQATFRIFHGSHRVDTEMEESAIELLDQALQLEFAASNRTLTFQLIKVREQMGMAYHACFSKLLSLDIVRSKQCLDAAKECFSVCLTGREAMGNAAQIAENKYWIALFQYERRIQGWVTSNETFQALLEAEAAFDALRLEISASSGFSAVKDKQALARQKHVRDIYRFAFQISVLDGDAANAWQWVQKAKARSLSDTLGIGCLIPETLLSRIKSDGRAQELYDQEQKLSQRLKSVAQEDFFSIAVALRRLQAQMGTIPVLRELLDLRQGKAVTAEDLLTRWQKLPVGCYATNVAFVDWYVKGEDEIYVLIVRPTANPILYKVNAAAHEIRVWIKEYLHSEDGQKRSIGLSDEHPSQALRALDVLVEFVGDHVDDDTLLVLSPVTPLDALPLHALHVRRHTDQRPSKSLPLIERNPIIYCSNMTVFLQCYERAASKSPTRDFKASLMAVYEEMPPEPFNARERQAVYNYVRDLALQYSTSAVVGHDVSCSRISSEWPSADYILFHGHCDQSLKDITEQSLILAPSTISTDGFSSAHMTVEKVFDLDLTGPLVALMACSSSVQEVSAGDEPLGLVSALLCAGAASVVGTLWPVASGTARRFMNIFEQKLRALQTVSLTGPDLRLGPSMVHGMIDLAIVVQRTVQELKETGPRLTRTPSHWAAFVAHGSALFPMPPQ